MGPIFSPKEIEWIERHSDLIESGDTYKIHRELVSDLNQGAFNVRLNVSILYLKNKLEAFSIKVNKSHNYSKFLCQIGPDPGQAYMLSSFTNTDEDTSEKIKARFIRELIGKSWVNNGILDILKKIIRETEVIWNG